MPEPTVVNYYRIVDSDIANNPPILQTMFVARATPKGAWVVYSWSTYEFLQKCRAEEEITSDTLRYWGAKIIYHAAKRKFAYPTKELALESYKIRKRRQIQHAENTLRHAKENLEFAERAELTDDVLVFQTLAKDAIPWSPNPLI